MNFKITLPTEKTHEKSGIMSGDYKWYQNISPRKINYKGVPFYVASHLEIYEESSTRVIPKGGSKLVYKDDQVYWVFTQIENEDEKAIEANWLMVVRNMEGTELFAKSYEHS